MAERALPAAGLRDWLLLAALGIVWGAAFGATKLATRDFAPLSIAGLRLAIGAAALFAVLRLSGARLPGWGGPAERRFWGAALAVGFLANAMPFSLLGWAQRHIDSALAAVLMATVPLLVLLLGHFFVPGERITGRRVAGFVLGFAGVVTLIGPEALLSLGHGGSLALAAQLACLLVAFGYASGAIVARLAPPLGLLRFGTATLIFAALMTLPAALVLERPWSAPPSAAGLLSILYLGLLATAVATVMLLAVIASAGPGFLSLVNYQVPVWGVVFGTLFLGESPSPGLAAALAMILAGLALAQGRPRAGTRAIRCDIASRPGP